jgi:hypothetical protein
LRHSLSVKEAWAPLNLRTTFLLQLPHSTGVARERKSENQKSEEWQKSQFLAHLFHLQKLFFQVFFCQGSNRNS